MTVKGGFTSAGQPGPDSQHQHQVPASGHMPSPMATADLQSDASSSTVIAHADSHRQSHSSSKLPAFRFTDRRSSSCGSVPLANKGDPLSLSSSNQYNHNRNQNLDSRNNNKDDRTSDYLNHKPTTSASATASASTPTSPLANTLDSASAALSLQSSILSSIVSPNSEPSTITPTVSVAPTTVSPVSADPGLVSPPSAAVSGLLTAPDPGPAPATLATTHSHTSHPTTHHRDEKHAVSALTPAPASASAHTDPSTNTASPSSQPKEPKSSNESDTTLLSQNNSGTSSVHPSSSVIQLSPGVKRPASFDAHAPDAISPHPAPSTSKSRTRRPLVSRRSTAGTSSTGPPPSLNSERLQAIEAAQEGQSTWPSSSDNSPQQSPSGQRELILPKTLSRTNSDERRASASHRPPVSYRPPLTSNSSTESSPSTAVRVPPIRSFRSSGSRKSLTLDMNSRPRFHDSGDEVEDTNHDRTLRALEGRGNDDALRSAPLTSSRRGAFDNEDTGDVFLKIAREEASQRQTDEQPQEDTRSVVSRATRFTHRRPLSSVVPIHQPTSPPRVRRRLSDQQDTARSRSRGYEDDRATELSRMSTYRTLPREKTASAHPGEDTGRMRGSTSTMRPSPVTPRSIVFQEPSSENSMYSRRRSSVTDNNVSGQNRGSAYKFMGHGHNKTYNSSPLVRSFDFQRQANQEAGNGAEGTESTLSNTAPSTVWDELDDLKSRIHRLELTGKLPSTSGAAVSRLSDDRPPTATTTATTMSSSPKRVENGHQNTNADAVSTTSSHHRESHSILQSALAKSKVLLDTEVYQALESAANDAMALASMMGTPGLPGPISSGASTIGSNATVTDRQLRRKAESVCRSLTELCLALGEDATQTRIPRQSIEIPPPAQNDAPTTPTIGKTFSGFSQRRQSIGRNDQTAAKEHLTSPRTLSKFEERRLNILNGSSLPTSRVSNSIPSTPIEPISNRRSSLLVSRSRRAGTEEPDEGRKSSLLLRTRRAGTEEPDEGRRTSLFVRNRRNTVGEEGEEESRFRAPSRAPTELGSTIRVVTQDQTPQQQQYSPSADTTSAIPRRRFVSSNLGASRLATPSVNTATPPRRYMERPAQQDHGNSAVEKLAEERAQRYTSLGQTTMVNRTSSMIRRPKRDSIASANPSAAAGSYR
ncbi:hypothetical protein BFJ70_g14499 [Fusarium oxysporum]|uniref:Uncharacterized protein n=1 Tax=Fusarium oxysporum Fo47 TaxID=660027 RepID=W9KK79_FUSOX|nr:uncharacterized protein FOBCDRAFT_290222 [Fusarium oxysporum Fo47]EWZ98291.1 hypothetical protein FOWG_02469 [Fusarium oxysporum f. sp. lycopersici MN25]KAJ4283159.1 hypothetical protein NW764_002562 [Fusarium oxysporum]EWZ44827.1 hypothetical protein FOZG_05415 [Fusarium oxysporum Fo47]QKD51335.1 hypothetical protein FOBCDRAFT_290222 [Fusarium oxysporum Fo47]RKL17836.1 hypothetical protein BFJ70_g14499 [Fusarium oxysporum]